MAEIIFHISDLHCENCIEKIRHALWHLSEKLLKIVGETDPLEMAQILQDIGYTPVLFPEDNVQ